MTRRWVAIRAQGRRYIQHLVEEWRPNTGKPFRHDAICGRVDTDATIKRGEDEVCWFCLKLETGPAS